MPLKKTPTGEHEVFKAWYDKTLRKQKNLREWLDRLVDTGGLVAPEERMNWFDLVADALLGQDKHIPAHITPAELSTLDGNEYARVENIGDFLQFLAYVESKPKEGTMSHFWKRARSGVWRVIPFALEVALRLSPERIPYEREIHDPFRRETGE